MPGNESDQPLKDTESQPEDTFALVGHEIRAEIIQDLGPFDELSLSELRSVLDIDVEPSQLHYHLQQLVGHFVEKSDDGYRLNSVGTRLRWTLRAGSLDRREEHVTVDANFECYYCQVPVEVIFNKGTAKMVCPECDHLYMKDYYILPLDVFEDETAGFSQFSQYLILKMFFLSHNVCHSCANHLSPTFQSPEGDHPRKVLIDKSCELCGASWLQSVGMALLADPVLLSFCYDHGVNVLSTPHWELEFAATDEHVTVHSTDPWEVALEVTFDGDTLELVVDGDLNVIERNRLDSSGGVNSRLLREIHSDLHTMLNRGSGEGVILPDTADCVESLRRHRWQHGVTCPHCDSRDQIKKGTTNKGAQRYRCQDCDSSFNDLTGTIFAERGLSLPEMFHIIRAIDNTKTAQIARQLDRSYKSVLDFVHTVQEATTETLESDP